MLLEIAPMYANHNLVRKNIDAIMNKTNILFKKMKDAGLKLRIKLYSQIL
jgi:hypothetical protein